MSKDKKITQKIGALTSWGFVFSILFIFGAYVGIDKIWAYYKVIEKGTPWMGNWQNPTLLVFAIGGIYLAIVGLIWGVSIFAKHKKQERKGGTQTSWKSRVVTFLGALLLAILTFVVFTVVGAYMAIHRIYHVGGPWYEDLQDLVTILFLYLGVAVIGVGFALVNFIYLEWTINHVAIYGSGLEYVGRTVDKYCHFVKWILLTFLTVGAYALLIPLRIKEWRMKNVAPVAEEFPHEKSCHSLKPTQAVGADVIVHEYDPDADVESLLSSFSNQH